MSRRVSISVVTFLFAAGTGACATLSARVDRRAESDPRRALIARAQVWNPTDVPTMDVTRGPEEEGSFPFRATVVCDYVDKKLEGNSPKFTCRIGADDEVKVKFGGTNGEVYGEVLATRLLWALGFGADRMYPVNVICRGCPPDLGGIERPGDESRFDPAVIERKMPGKEWPKDGKPGWSWRELDQIDPEAGGAPRSHRDALKLLAVFLQHTDSKRQQQRIVCLGPRPSKSSDSCVDPFLMINDLGLTFGRANFTNANRTGSVNLAAWGKRPVWKNEPGCIGNLDKSFTGTLDKPVISEEGRRFLANLLIQLSDRQIHDLFAVARVELRLRTPGKGDSGFATVDEWVDAFKKKRDDILERRCA